MSGRDEYYNRAKQVGYRSRSAFKLHQLDDGHDLIDPDSTVVDLGAAPGGWLQVVAERAPDGHVVAVDRQRIEPLADEPGADGATVETIRGDLEEGDTRERIREAVVGEGGGAVAGDENAADRGADLVISDAAPNVTGAYETDHARSVYLAGIALDVATDVLAPGGDLVVKVFQGRDLDQFRAEVESAFDYATTTVPDATRDRSSEVYVVGKGRIDAPVSEGDRLTLEIVDTGAEGDGIARVDDFTVFVSGADTGSVVDVEITDVKPRFAFASPVTN